MYLIYIVDVDMHDHDFQFPLKIREIYYKFLNFKIICSDNVWAERQSDYRSYLCEMMKYRATKDENASIVIAV